MKKASKLTLAVMVCAVILSTFSFTAFAKDDRYSVYVHVPNEWNMPCVWAWNDDGTNVYDAWPGGELEKDPENDGWYYCWLPIWANNVIINANEGTVQIDAVQIEPQSAWITIFDTESVDITYEALTVGETPKYEEKFVVHAIVPASWDEVGVWAWSAPDGTNAFTSWPGEMMRSSEDGSYLVNVPIWVNSIIINGNNGTVQTEDISVDAAEVWITVLEDGSYDLSYKDPTKASVDNINVYVVVPSEWNTPALWAWSAPDGTNVYASWPGEVLETSSEGWLSKSVPGWINSIIINANDGTVQTVDIDVEMGKNVWIIVNGSDDYAVTYEEPVVQPVEGNSTNIQQQRMSVVVMPVIIVLIIIILGSIGIVAYKNKNK